MGVILEKLTKRDSLTAVRKYLVEEYPEAELGEIPVDMIIEQIDAAIAGMDKRNMSAAKRNAKKAAEDPLKDILYSLLTTDYQSREQLAAQLPEDIDHNLNKITARLTQLFKEEKVEKSSIKDATDSKRTVMGYRLIG